MHHRLLALLTAALCAAAAAAQDKTETLLVALRSDKPTKGAVAESLSDALKVMAKAPGLKPDDQAAFKKVSESGLSVTPISVELYNAYGKLGDSNFQPTELPLVKSKAGGVEVRPLETADPAARKWELKLTGEDNPRLSGLTVKYAEVDKPVVYDDPNSTKKGAVVRFSSPQHYVLTLPANVKENKGGGLVPESFTAAIESGPSAAPTKVVDEGEWPSSGGFFLVTLKGFPTDVKAREMFTAVITNNGKGGVGGSALKALNIKKNVSIAVGDAISGDGINAVDTIDGNKFFLKVPVLSRQNGTDTAHKAYVLFPLSEEAAKAKADELDKMNVDKKAGWTAEYIRDKAGLSVYAAKDADALVELDKGKVKPRWYELLRTTKTLTTDDTRAANAYSYKLDENSEYFARPISLVKPDGRLSQDDAKNLTGAFKDGSAHGVVVYIYSSDTVFNAVPDTVRKGQFARVCKFDEWGRALRPIASDEPKAPAPK